MKLTFNQLGVLTDIVYDTAYRQGSVGTTVTAKFTNRANYDYVAKLNITRPDDTALTDLIMLPSSTNTDEFSLVFNDEWFFAVAGTTTLTVYLYDGGGNVLAQGQVQFDIEETDYSDDPPSITTEQYNTLLAAMTNKLNKYTGDYGIYATDGEGEQTILNYSNDHENGDTVVMRKSNGQLDVPQTPSSNNDAASKKYVDDNVNLKQNKLVAGLGINIETNPENANQQIISSYFYNCSVTTNLSDLYEKFEDSTFLLNTSDRGFAGKITYDNSVYHFEFLEIGNNRKYIGNVGDTLVYSILTGTTYKVDFYEKSEIDTLLSNIYIKSEVDGLISTEQLARSSADTALQNSKLDKTDVVNSLTDTSSTKPLSAGKGKELKDAVDTINSILSSDDTDLDTIQEIVNFIKDNKDVIDSVSTNKINYTDIVDNLTTAESGKPLSAKQGKVLKDLLDALTIVVGTKANSSDVYTKTQSDNLLDAKADKSTTYTKTEIDTMVDGFVFADIDNELDDDSPNPLENATVTRELNKKANVDGNYPTMTVGSADSLTPYSEDSGATDTSAFTFQSSGGNADINVLAYLKALRGNTVALNQLIDDGNFASGTNWATEQGGSLSVANNKATITTDGNAQVWLYKKPYASLQSGHKYLVCATLKSSVNSSFWFVLSGYYTYVSHSLTANTKTYVGEIIDLTTSYNNYKISLRFNSGTNVSGETIEIENVMVVDLTLMFGAGNEPTTVAEFNRLFPQPYYAYNQGQLLSCKSTAYKTVGYNAFDGDWESGTLVQANGSEISSNNGIRSDFIRVISGQTYSLEWDTSLAPSEAYFFYYDGSKNYLGYKYFGTPGTAELSKNCCYIRIEFVKSGWGTNIPTTLKACLHLTWDGSKTGYEAYEAHTYTLPNVELKSAGNAYDELKPDGTKIVRIGSVDLGTLDWSAGSENRYYAYLADVATVPNGSVKGNLLCPKYITTSADYRETHITENQMYLVGESKYLYIVDTKTYADAAAFKSAMSGVMLYYELATPTEEQTSNTFQEITPIDDFGTQEFLSEQEIQVPQGAEFFYPVDYKAFVDSLYNKVEGDTTEFVTQSDLATALSTFLTSISGYDATKSQTLKHDNSGNVKWVDD